MNEGSALLLLHLGLGLLIFTQDFIVCLIRILPLLSRLNSELWLLDLVESLILEVVAEVKYLYESLLETKSNITFDHLHGWAIVKWLIERSLRRGGVLSLGLDNIDIFILPWAELCYTEWLE